MTNLLQRIPEEFSDAYVVPEIFPREAAALFKRLNLPIRAVMDDNPVGKNFFGLPVISSAEVKFNTRTILIVLAKKSVPFIQTTFDFKVRGGLWKIPALVMASDEILAVYDRVLLMRYVNAFAEDGITPPPPTNLPEHFARGLTTFLDARCQNFNYQLWDSRAYFKPTYTFDDTAIVIQGPIEYANNYTAETFKLYRSIYPNAPIILSTWKGEATADFRKTCAENSVVLLENEPPEIRGGWNINLQIKSSFCGVEYVRENTSAKFVLKTRTDQRINRFDFLVYFKNLLETFPPKGDKLQRRIIFLHSINTKSMPFFLTDFLSFGHVLDISKLYSVPLHQDSGEMTYTNQHVQEWVKLQNFLENPLHSLDYDKVTDQNFDLYNHNKLLSHFCNPEIYIVRTFYKRYIAPIDETKLLETNWKFIVDYLLLIDFEAIQLDWPKYEWMRYQPKFDRAIHNTFSRWLDMYRNFKMD